jgi:hypothetical protein
LFGVQPGMKRQLIAYQLPLVEVCKGNVEGRVMSIPCNCIVTPHLGYLCRIRFGCTAAKSKVDDMPSESPVVAR